MPYDITMCSGGDCTLKENCLRFTGKAYGRYDSFGNPPFNTSTNNCESYMDDRPEPAQIQQKAYQLWLQEGTPSGSDLYFWLSAEKELLETRRNN